MVWQDKGDVGKEEGRGEHDQQCTHKHTGILTVLAL